MQHVAKKCPGTGKTHLAKKIVEAFESTETRCRRWVWWLKHGKLRNGHCSAIWLVIKELTQLDTAVGRHRLPEHEK